MKPPPVSLRSWFTSERIHDQEACKAPAPCECILCTAIQLPMPPFGNTLRLAAEKMYRRVMRHRERYIRAWIAATGLHPLECEVVEQRMPDGSMVVYVRKREAVAGR